MPPQFKPHVHFEYIAALGKVHVITGLTVGYVFPEKNQFLPFSLKPAELFLPQTAQSISEQQAWEVINCKRLNLLGKGAFFHWNSASNHGNKTMENILSAHTSLLRFVSEGFLCTAEDCREIAPIYHHTSAAVRQTRSISRLKLRLQDGYGDFGNDVWCTE